MATLKDVAQLAGVTVTTVSRMLNGRYNVSAKTRARIEDAMKTLGYRPNEVARSLAKKTSNLIGLIVPSAQNFFFSCVIERVEAHAAAHGCKLLLCVSDLDSRKEKEYFNMLLANKVMGIISAGHTQNVEDYTHLDAPILIIERSPAPNIPCALTDNYQGGYLAAEHLIAKGCRNLLYLSGHLILSADPSKRYLGFSAACEKHGVHPPKLFDAPWDEFISMNYDRSVEQLFREYPETDGILTSNDIMAAAILRYCAGHGIDVPRQLKVVGYDDTPFATHNPIPLTTIHQPIDELCQFAVSSLIRIANGEVVPISATFPVYLVERETT